MSLRNMKFRPRALGAMAALLLSAGALSGCVYGPGYGYGGYGYGYGGYGYGAPAVVVAPPIVVGGGYGWGGGWGRGWR